MEQQKLMMGQQDQRHKEEIQAILAMTKKSKENQSIKTFTGVVPSFSAFDSATELWMDYWERFKTFTEANSVPEEKKAYIFLTYQTLVTYKLLTNLASQQHHQKMLTSLVLKIYQSL